MGGDFEVEKLITNCFVYYLVLAIIAVITGSWLCLMRS